MPAVRNQRPRSALQVSTLVTYRNRTEARKDLRRRIASYTNTTKLNALDREVFLEIIKNHHPSLAEWLGLQKVKSLSIKQSATSSPSLHVSRSDKQSIAFSVQKAFESFDLRESKRRAAVVQAMRTAVEEQRRAYEDSIIGNTQVHCAMHKGPFNSQEMRCRARYRNNVTFEGLVKNFEEELGVEVDVLDVHDLLATYLSQKRGASGKFNHVDKGVWQLSDTHMENRWKEFHDVHATYEMVCGECEGALKNAKTVAKKKKTKKK